METRLAWWIIETRKGVILVETWMVDDEGKDILHQLYPLSLPDTSEFIDYPFKFSNNCQKGFFNSHKRKISKRNNFSIDKKDWNHKSKTFHLETITFKISKINDPVWGFAPCSQFF